MRAFGFLSFGHYGNVPGSRTRTAGDMLRQHVELAEGADELGVNGAYVRVHHFARQAAAPIPLLTAMALRTKHIEVGTGVIDMRYENPLMLAEEAAALDLLADGRLALGISRGSPEPALRGYEAFGYTDEGGDEADRGESLARDKFALFLRAVEGERIAEGDPQMVGPGQHLAIEPHSPTLRDHVWWGAGSRASAEAVGRMGLNLMSSTLLTEATGQPFHELQREQIDRFRGSYREAGHRGSPRVSVSRSVFPLVSEQDELYFGLRSRENQDQIGVIDGFRSTFGKTYADTPDRLIEQLRADEAVMAADTLMLTIPSQLGVEYNLHVLEAFAAHVAPALGWKSNLEGPVLGDAIG